MLLPNSTGHSKFRPLPSGAPVVTLIFLLVLSITTANAQTNSTPTIEFTEIPAADKGGLEMLTTIKGRVRGAQPGQQVVLYARSGDWFVQPFVDQPFTRIESDSTWSNSTHLGTEYAALLVEPGFRPENITRVLPGIGNGVVAVASVHGTPPFWQTWWFRIAAVLAALFVVFMYFRARQKRMVADMNMRFEQRLAERTRIAQDLHDTLLQGLLSASIQLHVADNLLANDSPAKPLVGRVLQLMGQVVEEGRNAVRGLRSSIVDSEDLEQAFAQIQQESDTETHVDYEVVVKGSSKGLRPVIRDEVYRVGREALVNAFRHSKATRIEVELEYAAKQLRVLIRDNGRGIDPEILKQGRDGHWGLSGMRERTDEIGGKLMVWSRTGVGTEVELVIPGHIAFENDGSSSSPKASKLGLFRLSSRKRERK